MSYYLTMCLRIGGNNPVSRVDPNGNDWWDYVKAGLIGAAEGAGDACLTIVDPPLGAERVAAKIGLKGAGEAGQSFLKMDLQLFAKKDIKQIESIAKCHWNKEGILEIM